MAAPLLRKEAAGKKTISDADLAAVNEATEPEIFSPHRKYSQTELDEKYPSLESRTRWTRETPRRTRRILY